MRRFPQPNTHYLVKRGLSVDQELCVQNLYYMLIMFIKDAQMNRRGDLARLQAQQTRRLIQTFGERVPARRLANGRVLALLSSDRSPASVSHA